ncbi:hypothetical protein E2C01_047057 [Portunus trituberculatus]|uniref:Uncharacterized protein n=1 Tax=Portunus trituberculatus TaxID=210409 RepID=A0A5B7FZE0_PORTR|nr:hypothetical protein [Portunus trituberculatus]
MSRLIWPGARHSAPAFVDSLMLCATLTPMGEMTARRSTNTTGDFVINGPLTSTMLSVWGTNRPVGVGTGRRLELGETCPAVGGACPRP